MEVNIVASAPIPWRPRNRNPSGMKVAEKPLAGLTAVACGSMATGVRRFVLISDLRFPISEGWTASSPRLLPGAGEESILTALRAVVIASLSEAYCPLALRCSTAFSPFRLAGWAARRSGRDEGGRTSPRRKSAVEGHEKDGKESSRFHKQAGFRSASY